MFNKLWNDDAGVVTIEYLVLGTFLGLALIVGVHALAAGVNTELTELSGAVTSFSQEYSASGFSTCQARTEGSSATDLPSKLDITPVSGTNSIIDVTACN